MSDDDLNLEIYCPDCNGTGEAPSQPDPSDPTGMTPMQVQCHCITGKILISKNQAREMGIIQ